MNIYTKNQSKDKIVSIPGYSIGTEGSEYPTGINEPFRKLMLERIANSVLSRTGYDIRDYERVIHATCSPGRDKNGNIIDHAGSNLVRNV